MPDASYSAATDRSTGVISDQQVMLNGHYSAKKYPQHMRRIRFKDPESGKTLIFLTNHMALPALTIAALYKSRWQVELFFKWIKQHLRIKHFMGNSENAVKTQIWCAVATYVLIAIVKKELQLDASLYTCLQILSVSVFEKTQLSCALSVQRLDNASLSIDQGGHDARSRVGKTLPSMFLRSIRKPRNSINQRASKTYAARRMSRRGSVEAQGQPCKAQAVWSSSTSGSQRRVCGISTSYWLGRAAAPLTRPQSRKSTHF